MKYTSKEANKLLKKLVEEKQELINSEEKSCIFTAAVGEKIEEVRPEYSFIETTKKISEIEEKIRLLKHKINQFNVKTMVPGFDMTIDEMLVYIPELTVRKSFLRRLVNRLPRERSEARYNANIIEYEYTNYDLKDAKEEYDRVSIELSNAQIALDLVNSTKTMDIDL